jgi:hypothetical protein
MLRALARSAPFALAALLLSGAHPAFAQRGGDDDWVKLGEQKVGFFGDHDTIRVGKREGRFDKLAFIVRRNDIDLISLVVVYGNGKKEELAYRETLRQGQRSRPIDLRGEGRTIQEIQLVYRSKPSFKGEAVLEVYGRQADDKHAGGGGRDSDGKRAHCDVYSQIAVVQAEANEKYKCGLRGPQWNTNARDHFQWCRFVRRDTLADEYHNRAKALQDCFNRLGDYDDDTWDRNRRR